MALFSVESLYERWERELAQLHREPDPVVIAALEYEAREQGFDLLDIHQALVAAPFFDESLHPRGKDGKFIEVGGLVKLLNFKIRGKNGKDYDFGGQRGKVMGITPNPKSNKLATGHSSRRTASRSIRPRQAVNCYHGQAVEHCSGTREGSSLGPRARAAIDRATTRGAHRQDQR